MPAIASLEDLKAARKDLRSMFLAVTPYASRSNVRYAMRYAVGSRIKLNWMICDICIPNSAFGNPHLVGSGTIER